MDTLELGAVVTGLTGVVRQIGVFPSRYLPLIAVLIGAFLSAGAATGTGKPVFTAVIEGILVGATTTGLVKTAGEISKKTK